MDEYAFDVSPWDDSAGRWEMTSRWDLVHVGIDFVGDPIVFEEKGEEHAGDPKNPTSRKPGRTERGSQERNVDDISGGVADVGEESEGGHWEKRGELERGTKMGPRADEPDGADGGEDEVVEDAARFPKAGGGGEEFEEARGLLDRSGWRGHKDLQSSLRIRG